MNQRKPHYDKIVSLTRQLSDPGITVTQKRQASKKIEEQLSNHDVREKLAIETTPSRTSGNDFSISARRCQMLSMLWSNALMRCILTSREIIQSKRKITIEDVRVPDRILRASSQPDEAFDSNGLGIPKLSKKSVRNALKFCFEALENENIPDGGEQVLLDMLVFLCSRDEFVGCFKYPIDFRNVLSEVIHHLEKEDVTPIIFESASKAFGNFFCTCSRLEIEVHNFISDSLQTVAEWCKINIQRNSINSSSNSRQHFFNAVACMLTSHPDHSIGPMKRYGRHILRFCKRAYAAAQGLHKEALNRYILAHLFVAQAAGKIQGLIDGDLGDLGSASLTERQVVELLELGINDVVRGFGKNTNAVTVNRKRQQKSSSRSVWCPLDDRQKLQLEVVTRLLACAQRLYISRESWNALDNPDAMLRALLKVPSSKKDGEWIDPVLPEAQELSVGVQAKSPWINLVLRKLIPPNYVSCTNHDAAMKTRSEEFGGSLRHNSLSPVLEFIWNDNHTNLSIVPYLSIIGASAELFPAGECWVMSATENWCRLVPKDKMRGEVVWYHASRAFDLVSILSMLSKLLEEHGQPESDTGTQYWILLVLTKLTETTAVLIQNLEDLENGGQKHTSLTMVWRTIWKTLLRSDLRYASFTNLGENSLGEIFVILLTDIISRRCTEIPNITSSLSTYNTSSTFVREQQKSLWSLLLRKPTIFTKVRSRAQFELISSILKFSGLLDSRHIKESKRPLRWELLHLALSSFKEVLMKRTESSIYSSSKVRLTRSIAYCIIFLVNGYCPSSMSRLSSADSRFLLVRCGAYFVLDEENRRTLHSLQNENDIASYLRILWDNEIQEEHLDDSFFRSQILNFDPPRLVAKRLRDFLHIADRKLETYTCDFISERDSEEMQRKVFSFVQEEIPYVLRQTILSTESSDGAFVGKGAQTVAAKLNLSILVSQKCSATDLLARIPDIITFFTSSVSDLVGSCFESPEYLEIASNLLQVSQTLIEIIARRPSNVSLSQRMITPIVECQSVLKQYSCQSQNDDQCLNPKKTFPMTSSPKTDEVDFDPTDSMSPFSEPSFDEEDSNNLKKSNRREADGYEDYNEKRAKRRKPSSPYVAPPNIQCAKAIGALLISMEPSVSNCRLVCETILGTDIDVDPESIQGDMDLNSVKKSICFLSMREVLLNNLTNQKGLDADDPEELSPVVMLCQLIDLVRECTDPFSRYFICGYLDCVKVGIKVLQLGFTLTSEEVKSILGVLSVEDGMRGRYSLRAERCEAATYIYENASNDFRLLIDKFFTNLIKAGFDDANFILRRLASIGAGVASDKLDEQRVLKSVSSRIAPIYSSMSAEKITDEFTRWYIESGLSSTEEQKISCVEAKDSLEVMESDSIFSKALLAGSIRDRKAFIQLLQEVLSIPGSRPGLEFMNYRALEKIAFMRGYSNVQELVDLESESLLAVWLQKTPRETNEDTYTEFLTLSLTSPKAMWYIMMYGRYDYLMQSQFSPYPNEDSVNFRNESAVNFFRRHRNFIVPFTLLKSHNTISQCKSSQDFVEHLFNDFGFRVLLAMTASKENGQIDDVYKLLKRHAIAIQTMCILLVHSDDQATKQAGQNILGIFTRVLSDSAIELNASSTNTPLLIKRVLQVAGQERNLYGIKPFSESSYYRAIKHFASTLGKTQKLSGDVFIDADTTLTEITIYAYDKLMKAKLADYQYHAWSRFVLLGEFLADQFENGHEKIQLDVFLHVLNEIISNTSLHKRIRIQALFLIQKVLVTSLHRNETVLNREVCPAVSKLVAVCFHVHEECQRDLIIGLREKLMKQKFDLRRSRGVQGQRIDATCDPYSDDSVSAHKLVHLLKASPSAQMNHKCLVGTHDILLWIVQNKEKLRLDCCVFANLSNSFEIDRRDLDALCNTDKRYSAQVLAQDLRENKKNYTFHEYISGLKYQLLTPHFAYGRKHLVKYDSSSVPCNRDTVHERLLCAELSQIEDRLKDGEISEADDSDISSLLSYLFHVGKSSNSSAVRSTLSRCIALLVPSTLTNISMMSNTNMLFSKSSYDKLQLGLRARCFDCLAELLKSRKTEVAMAAVTTLEAILSKGAGRVLDSMIAPSTVALIKSFVRKKQSSRKNFTVLLNGEKRSLMKFLGTGCNKGIKANQGSWCWDHKLWTLHNSGALQFEDWIRRVTCAIIVCCFDPDEIKDSDGKLADDFESSFFWHCQRITYLNDVFAATIFPLLILTLVQRENPKQDQNYNSLKRSIAMSFESVLFSWIRPEKSSSTSMDNNLKFKSLSIVIDTLDVLRKVSQGTFLSLKHKPNKTMTPKKNSKGGHNIGLGPLLPRQKIPYGVILHIDGTIVAKACMEVKRFASALFFLEMYFNSQYGKSGGLFEELDNAASCVDVIGKFHGTQDVSGMNCMFETNDSDDDELKARTMEAMSMTSRCYKGLGEIELMHATNMQLSSLDFTANLNTTAADLENVRGLSSLEKLQMLDFHSRETNNSVGLVSSLTESMEAVGLEGMISNYIEGVLSQNEDLTAMVDTQMLREKWFENSIETKNWNSRTGDLSTNSSLESNFLTSSATGSNRGYFESVSEALNSLSNSDTVSCKLALERAQTSVISSLSDVTGESLSSDRFIEIIDKLRALQDIRKLSEDEVDFLTFDFNQMWTLKISSRIRQITLISLASKYPEQKKALKLHLWKSCDYAVSSGRPQIAEIAVSRLKNLLNEKVESHNLVEDTSNEILRLRLQEAKIMECRGDFNGAIQRSKQLIRHIGDRTSNKIQKCLLCDAQILCGSWMTKYKTQQARDILERYLNPASIGAKQIFDEENTVENTERATRVFLKLGHKLANLHDDLLFRIQSKDWEETENRLQHQRQQCLDSLEHRKKLKREYAKLSKNSQRKEEAYKRWKETEGHFSRLEKEYKSTTKERSGIRDLVPYYLRQSLNSFLSALAIAGTSSNDLSSHIFRMISLWFLYQDNSSNDSTDDLNANDIMRERLCKIPSFRFVSLTNQLFSRIDTGERINDQKFQNALQSLVLRMCNGHPYHCIVPLVALMNGKVASNRRGAQQIIDEIEQSGAQYVRDLLHSYRILISAYNDLAHISTAKYQGSSQQRKKKIKFSEVFPSATKKCLDRCLSKLPGSPCVMTCPPPVRPGKDYGYGNDDPIGGERIAGFESDFSITDSGVHRPKIVMCIGSKGGSFRQLVKGEDDIRQDAIMSQVFYYVNNLMKRRSNLSVNIDDPKSLSTCAGYTRRRLTLRTYNVLPLSPSSGVLEWVEGTLPVIDYVNDRPSFGRIGSHSRYYPGEWSNNTCRLHLEKSPPEEKRQSFDEICARNSPSFRFFFLERFGGCMELWHAAKMNFTRSVAVNSIVGHILGIGDRHLGNILIDQGSGEVVHIDFGFVFEQGKLLPIPECIPFRLTRNMVDGMGPCGTEGLFVAVAEETMSLLRQHVQELLAILSAVVADPLYKWSKDRTKARRVQEDQERGAHDPEEGQTSGSSASRHKTRVATKTINKIKEKLQGYEDSTSGEQQGIEGQVQLLINSARDPNNLCKIFPGWGPWI